MATKAQLQAQIDSYNMQVNALKTEAQTLQNSKESLKATLLAWVNGYNSDFVHCGDPIIVNSVLGGGASTVVDTCHRSFPFSDCSKDGCSLRVVTINQSLANYNSAMAAVNAKNAEVTKILNLIKGLNDQILALPETQAQLQGDAAAQIVNADAEKKKWIIFLIIVLIIIAGAIFIFISAR